MSASVEYRQLATRHRLLAQQEELPNVRALLAASAEKWAFLAEITAREDQHALQAGLVQQGRADSHAMAPTAT